MMDIRELLAELERNTCDLRCVNVPTGGDDFEVVWNVIEHHMDAPNKRIIGFGRTAIDALDSAFSNDS